MSVIKLSSPSTREFWEIPVLFEDEHLLALDKPAGLLLSPDAEIPERASLMRLLHDGIAAEKPWAIERRLTYLANAHQLDSETSGVSLLAKSKAALVTLTNHFGVETNGRRFIALVQGSPHEERFEVNARIGPNAARPGMMWVDPHGGKKSRSIFEVVERFSGYTVIRCLALTDREHQIRIHLQNSGLRVVGDELYGGKPLLLSRLKRDYRLKEGRVERPLISRAALHLEQLEFPHPVGGETIAISAPWPKDLTVAVKYLRQFGAV